MMDGWSLMALRRRCDSSTSSSDSKSSDSMPSSSEKLHSAIRPLITKDGWLYLAPLYPHLIPQSRPRNRSHHLFLCMHLSCPTASSVPCCVVLLACWRGLLAGVFDCRVFEYWLAVGAWAEVSKGYLLGGIVVSCWRWKRETSQQKKRDL